MVRHKNENPVGSNPAKANREEVMIYNRAKIAVDIMVVLVQKYPKGVTTGVLYDMLQLTHPGLTMEAFKDALQHIRKFEDAKYVDPTGWEASDEQAELWKKCGRQCNQVHRN